MKKIFSVLIFLFAVLLFAGAIAVILIFTNGGNEDFKTFYYEQNGEAVFAKNNTITLFPETETRFDVKYTFDTPNAQPRGYSMKIIPNQEADFEFTAGERVRVWRSVGELTDYFDVKKDENGFTLAIGSDLSIENLLERIYEGEDVKISDTVRGEWYKSLPAFYSLIISSYNEQVTYTVNFFVESPPKTAGEPVTIRWVIESSDISTADNHFKVGDVIGDYRPAWDGHSEWNDLQTWYIDKSCTFEYDFSEPLKGNLTLYAFEDTALITVYRLHSTDGSCEWQLWTGDTSFNVPERAKPGESVSIKIGGYAYSYNGYVTVTNLTTGESVVCEVYYQPSAYIEITFTMPRGRVEVRVVENDYGSV